ncbi:ATP-grasp domain-containing protein, partial [Pseudomonas sp. 5S4]
MRAIIPGSDSALKISDKLADHFFVVGNPVATCLSRVNKWEMKKRLISKGINATPSFKITLDELIEGAEFDIPFPMVVKPCQGTGSKNVKICNSRGDVYRALAAIESAGESYIAEEKFALMEEYIDGQEYFIATANLGKNLSRQILCFAEYEKIRVGNNPSVYKNIRSVSPLSEMALNAFSYVEQVNDTLEANIGINDIEFKINSKGVFIIEQNGRLPGANVPSLIELCTGINLYDLNIDLFLGVPPLYVHAPEYHKHFCICCLISYKGGNLKKIDGLEFVTELE